jgi:hypothetical protein
LWQPFGRANNEGTLAGAQKIASHADICCSPHSTKTKAPAFRRQELPGGPER